MRNGMWLGSLAFLASILILPRAGNSTCDMLWWWNTTGAHHECPDDFCQMCGKAPVHDIAGTCNLHTGILGGNPSLSCACKDAQDATNWSQDTCYLEVEFDPTLGPVTHCRNNLRADCGCWAGLLPPRGVACDRVADFVQVPTQICQCFGGSEAWGNP